MRDFLCIYGMISSISDQFPAFFNPFKAEVRLQVELKMETKREGI
jgi:hypothetical protein